MESLDSLFDIPFTNPTLIFFIVLAIILLAPIALQKIRVPHIIGLILAGALIGPNGTGILLRDTSFELFGKVGLLYLMFLAGLEMDIFDFKKNGKKGVFFGLCTFSIPMIIGTLTGIYLLKFSTVTSILLASMFASHTLVSYPIASRYGVTKNRAVTITIAGTIITDILALLILAVITGMYKGELNAFFWLKFGLSLVIYLIILFWAFPHLIKWFLRKYDDNATQFIFVLALVFSAAFGAELAGLEGIIGAFLAGVILNRYIPSVSPLMNRIEFVGNAFFIPYFLIGVGMLVDFKVLFRGPEALLVAVSMSAIATFSKWLAAVITQKTFKMKHTERMLMFGLSNGQAAATLAAVLIGYNIITGVTASGEAIRLLNENILNGTIIMILVTCTISSIATESAARNIATQRAEPAEISEKTFEEKILIPIANPSTIENLVNLALLMKSKVKKTPLYALSVSVDMFDNNSTNENSAKNLNKVAQLASAADTHVNTLSRYDVNVASGIIHTVKENDISDVVMGFHYKANIGETFFGPMTQNILRSVNRMVLIFRTLTPVNAINKMVVAIPAKAEYEIGFPRLIDRIANISTQCGCRAIFYTNENTEAAIQSLIKVKRYRFRAEFKPLGNWDDFRSLKNIINAHDLFILVSARPTSISYHSTFDRLPYILGHDFKDTNLLVIYPEQFGYRNESLFSVADPQSNDLQKMYPKLGISQKWIKDLINKKNKE